MGAISMHTGERIRTYRKARGLTIQGFSRLIHKSSSTISKYENGEISIDIETLFHIADKLSVSVTQLIDYKIERTWADVSAYPKGFFLDRDLLYLYHFDGQQKKIIPSVMELIHTTGENRDVILYWKVSDPENYRKCWHYYSGEMVYGDTYVNFVLSNQINNIEKIFLCAVNPLNMGDETNGIIAGISDKYRMPICYKFFMAKYKLPMDQTLEQHLLFSKEDYQIMRRINAFLLDSIPV